MKLRATVKKDDAGRLTQIQVRKGTQVKGVIMDFEYGEDGFVRDILFQGRREQLPNMPEIIDLVNESFIERIGKIQTIESIKEVLSVVVRPTKGTGDLLLYDYFEGLLKWAVGVIDNTYAYNGSNSLKVTCLDADIEVSAYRFIPFRPSLRVGKEFMFSIADNAKLYSFSSTIDLVTTTCHVTAEIRIKNGVVSVYTEGAWKEIIDIGGDLRAKDGVYGAWHNAKMVVDFTTKEYVSFRLNQFEVDLEGLIIPEQTPLIKQMGKIGFTVVRVAGNDAIMWFDDVVVTEE